MAIIKTKVPQFNGFRASVLFRNGVGKTDDTRLIEWFRTHGYIVEEDNTVNKTNNLDSLSFDELKELAKSNNIPVGNTKDKEKLISKLEGVM